MQKREFIPLDDFERLARWWWLITAAIILGGLVGYAIYSQRRPAYEATATFFVTLDANKISRELPLDRYQYDEDISLAATEGALRSNEVLASVITACAEQGLTFDVLYLTDNSIIERRHAFWELRFRHPDAKVAQTVVNLWAEAGYQQMMTWLENGNVANYVIFNPPILAELPQQPINDRQKNMMMGGAMIGLVAGIFAAEGMTRWKK